MAISSKYSQALIAVVAWLKNRVTSASNMPNFPTYIQGEVSETLRVYLNGQQIVAEVGSHKAEVKVQDLFSSSTYVDVDGSSSRILVQGSGSSLQATDYNDSSTQYRVSVSGDEVRVGNNSFRLS